MNNNLNKIFGPIFVAWFFISILAIIFFSNINTYYTLMVFGQVFFIMGIAATISIFKESKEKKIFDIGKSFVLLPVIIGLGCIIVPYLMINNEKFNLNIDWDNVLPILFLSIFFLAGIYLIICYFYKKRKLSDNSFIQVSSTVIEINESYSDDTIVYAPVLEYNFNGKNYTYVSNSYSNVGVPNIGDIIEVKVNPMNPEEIYYKSKSDIILLILGIIFSVIPLVIIYYMLFL